MREIPNPEVVSHTLTAEAERRIVGCALRAESSVADEILSCGLRPTDFADEAMGGIWRACLAVWARGAEVHLSSVGAELEHGNRLEAYGGPPGLTRIAFDCMTTANWQGWVAAVREGSEKRRTIAVARATLDRAKANGCTAAELRAELQAGAAALGGAEDTSAALRWFDLADCRADRSPYEPALVEPGLVFPGDLLAIIGPPKSQKSWLALDLCARWALGHDWLGLLTPTRPLCVAYLQFELRRDSWRRRVADWKLEPHEVAALRGRMLVTERCAPELDDGFGSRLRRSLPPDFVPDLVVVDPLANVYTGSENDNAEMAGFLRRLRRARDAVNPKAAIVLVHHTAKVGREQRTDDPFASARGASALRGAWDAALYIDRPHPDSEVRAVQWEMRNGREPPKLHVRLEDGRYVPVEAVERNAGQTMGEKWDAEAARKMRALLHLVRDEGLAGRAWTSSALAEEASQRHGLGSVRAIKGRLSELLQKHLLMAFDGAPHGLGRPPTTGRGYLCTEGMMLRADNGDMRAVEPRWHRDTAGGMVDLDEDTEWRSFTDYYEGSF